MRVFVSLVAGLWLFVVSVQGISHLCRYGLLPLLPEWVGHLDFTPQYTALMGLVILAAVARRLAPDEGMPQSEALRQRDGQ